MSISTRDRLQQLADQLAAFGVQHAFGVTGSGSTWVLISALESNGVAYHPVGHEAAGAIMAGGAFQASRRLSVSLSIKGPGLVNMAAGIAYNHFENLPVLSIAEAYSSEAPRAHMHKRLDQVALLQPLTKGCIHLSDANGLERLLADAAAEVPGPVHLELSTHPPPRAVSCEAMGSEISEWEPAIERIIAAQRPAVIVGALAGRRDWGQMLSSLRIPVFTTAACKGLLDERGRFAAGVFTGSGRELAPESWLIPQADLIVGLGLRNLEVIHPRTLPVSLIILDEAAASVASGFNADAIVPNAPRAAFVSALAALRHRDWGDDEIEAGLRNMRKELLADGWLPTQCFAVLTAIEWDHVLVLDTGSFCTIGEHIWQASEGRRFIGSSNGRFMGGGIPAAIGFAIATQGLPVFCAVGDGGMRMYPAEIRLAVQRQLPICFLFMCDGRYGSVACAETDLRLSRDAITFPQASWIAVMDALGCPAQQVRGEDQFAAAISEWDRRGPRFVECVFNADIYLNMTRRLRG